MKERERERERERQACERREEVLGRILLVIYIYLSLSVFAAPGCGEQVAYFGGRDCLLVFRLMYEVDQRRLIITIYTFTSRPSPPVSRNTRKGRGSEFEPSLVFHYCFAARLMSSVCFRGCGAAEKLEAHGKGWLRWKQQTAYLFGCWRETRCNPQE